MKFAIDPAILSLISQLAPFIIAGVIGRRYLRSRSLIKLICFAGGIGAMAAILRWMAKARFYS